MNDPATKDYAITICDDCYEFKGEMCHTPGCVFIRCTMDEVREYLNQLLIRPKIDGEYHRLGCVVDSNFETESPETSDEAEKLWVDFWQSLVTTNGILDIEKVKRELADYSMMLDHAPRVYMAVTGGMISKPNTTPEAVIGEFENYVSKLIDEAIVEHSRESQ